MRSQGATAALFFEARKRKDLYVWLARPPAGPTARFLASNVHTMAELKMSGNHLRASRPALAFDAAFDEQPHLQARALPTSTSDSLAYSRSYMRRHSRQGPVPGWHGQRPRACARTTQRRARASEQARVRTRR